MASRDFTALLDEIGIPQKSRRGGLEPVLALFEDMPRGRVLDVPCGPGLLAEALRRLGFRVTAADRDAAAFALHGSLAFRALDLEEPLPFDDGSFDFVHCGDGIEHVENPFVMLREFARVLRRDGTLVIATPNYLNLERRLRFLFTGSLTKPLPRRRGFDSGSSGDRGHINPLTLVRLAYMAENAGLRLARSATILPKPRQRLLSPLAWLIRLSRCFLPEPHRYNLFAEHTLSLGMLLGGKKLIAVFRKNGHTP
jgi:SAM-dependent methyltransferase